MKRSRSFTSPLAMKSPKPPPKYITNLFSPKELDTIAQILSKAEATSYEYNQLGRLHIEDAELPASIIRKLKKLVDNPALEILNPPLCVTYSSKYGQPHLNPHFDGDFTDYIIDVQLSSNTNWSLGVDLDVYDMADNSAVIFHPNKNVHWRPHKEFKDGEYVQVMFFRFVSSDSDSLSDYSYLPSHPDDEVFAEVRKLRDSLDR